MHRIEEAFGSVCLDNSPPGTFSEVEELEGVLASMGDLRFASLTQGLDEMSLKIFWALMLGYTGAKNTE